MTDIEGETDKSLIKWEILKSFFSVSRRKIVLPRTVSSGIRNGPVFDVPLKAVPQSRLWQTRLCRTPTDSTVYLCTQKVEKARKCACGMWLGLCGVCAVRPHVLMRLSKMKKTCQRGLGWVHVCCVCLQPEQALSLLPSRPPLGKYWRRRHSQKAKFKKIWSFFK